MEGKISGGEGDGGGADEAPGLGSWAADFGLFVSEDGGDGLDDAAAGQGAGLNPLVGWGAFEESLGSWASGEEEEGIGEGAEGGAVSGRAAVVGTEETGAAGGNAVRATAVKSKEEGGVMERPSVGGVAGKDGRGTEEATPYPAGGGGGLRSAVEAFVDLQKIRRDGGSGGRAASADLEMAARIAGGELYALGDRLSALSTALERRSPAASGKGAARVSAAAGEVASLRGLLKTGEYRDRLRRPADVRRAAKAAERLVRDAERAVERDIALLDDADPRQAAALAEISACREKLDAARKLLSSSAEALDARTMPLLLGALGKVQVSVDICADRLRQSDASASSSAADKLSLATCKAKVEAVSARVEKACAKRQHERPRRRQDDAGQDQGEGSRRSGDRWLAQARALRRAILGPQGVGVRERGAGSSRFREALQRLDRALAEADRLRADAAAGGGYGGDDAFAKAAREASRAAEDLQNAGEAVVGDESARVEGARKLVGMALQDLEEIEADVSDSGLAAADGGVVSEALRIARKRLEKVSGALREEGGGTGGATRRDRDRIEALVTNGSLESALRGVDEARAVVSRARRVAATEAEARGIVAEEIARADDISLRAKELGLFDRPAVARALQACRAASSTAERLGGRGGGGHSSPAKREALAQEYVSAALLAREATARAEETLALEGESAAANDEAKRRLKERLESSAAAAALLQGRLDRLAVAAEERRECLEGVRLLAASWKLGSAGKGLRVPVPPEPYARAASRATADARRGLDAKLREVDRPGDAAAIDDGVDSSRQQVAAAEAAAAQAEVRGRRRGNAIAVLEGAAARTEAVVADARAAKVAGRAGMVASLTAAARQVEGALAAAAATAERSGPEEVEVEDAFLAAARGAVQAAEAAEQAFVREKAMMEQTEDQRQERSAELYAAARRLEGLDTRGVIADDPEAAAAVLEARSEAMQVLAALEAADDPSGLLEQAQAALESASAAEETFVETQRRVRCFDDATRLLEQAEILVKEAQATVAAASPPAASAEAFRESLERYEGVLGAAATSSDGADAFLEACAAAFAAAREVDKAAARASRRVRARKERLRRELARLDRPAATLVALDLSELTDAGGGEGTPFRAAAERVRDALSAIASAREEVQQAAAGGGGGGSREQQGEAEEAALAIRVDDAVHAATSAERSFRQARDRARRMERGWRQLAVPEAAFARVREDVKVVPHAQVVSELCAASMQRAAESISAARAGVVAIGEDEESGAKGDVQPLIEEARLHVGAAQREVQEQTTRVKSADSRRQMLRSALVTSSDSLAQAQAGLEAERQGQPPGDSVPEGGGFGEGDPMSEALRACALAERAAAVARELLERPLTAESVGPAAAATEEEERAVEAAQAAATEAEQAAARLVERLGQIRGIRARLRSLLSRSEARFRQASAALADAGVTDVDDAVHVAGTALAVARDRLRSSLGSGYLSPDGAGGDSGARLARDEEAVSEAAAFVEALESFASRVAPTSTAAAPEHGGTTPASGEAGPENGEGGVADALALALQWGNALRARVLELRLGGDPAVAQALGAVGEAALAAESLWSPGERGGGDGRKAVESLAARLGELEAAAEGAAERRRSSEAGRGAATRRLDRLVATLGSLRETVESADEPLLVSLTSAALTAASDAVAGAAAAAEASAAAGGARGGSGGDAGDPGGDRQGTTAFTDAVQAAAVAVAQAEATVARARERAPQVSAERVRTLETLVGLAETLSEAGEQLSSSSEERGLPSSREAAAAILEAQAALARARAAAQADGGAWVSGAAAIAESVAEAGELVRRAKRAADPPAAVRPASRGGRGGTGGGAEEDVVAAEANARAWLAAGGEEGGVRGNSNRRKKPPPAPGDVNSRSAPAAATGARKARIGFSKKGEGAPTYLPLWMRLQKKLSETVEGRQGEDEVDASDDNSKVEASGDSSARHGDPAPATDLGALGRQGEVATQPSPPTDTSSADGFPKTVAAKLGVSSSDWRRKEEARLRAEVTRLKAEAARLRACRFGTIPAASAENAGGGSGSGSGGAEGPRSFQQAAEALAEEMVKDFATQAKKEAQQRRTTGTGESGDASPVTAPPPEQ